MDPKGYAYSFAPCGISWTWQNCQGFLSQLRVCAHYPFVLLCLPCWLCGIPFFLLKVLIGLLIDIILMLGSLLTGGCCCKTCKMWQDKGCCAYARVDFAEVCLKGCTFFKHDSKFEGCCGCFCYGCLAPVEFPSIKEMWNSA